MRPSQVFEVGAVADLHFLRVADLEALSAAVACVASPARPKKVRLDVGKRQPGSAR